MKNKLLLSIVFYFFLINFLYANNIALIDLNFIINNSLVGKNVLKKLDDVNNKNLNILKKDQESLNRENEDIEKTKNILSKDELDKKILTLNDKLKNFNQKQNFMSKEFQELKQKEMTELLNKINPIIEKYMIENNIDLMIKKENTYISKIELDVSKKIVELINKNILN